MSVVPGVRIEDMGHKMGCNGVDNGKLWFDRESPSQLAFSWSSNPPQHPTVFAHDFLGQFPVCVVLQALQAMHSLLPARHACQLMLPLLSKLAPTQNSFEVPDNDRLLCGAQTCA